MARIDERSVPGAKPAADADLRPFEGERIEAGLAPQPQRLGADPDGEILFPIYAEVEKHLAPCALGRKHSALDELIGVEEAPCGRRRAHGPAGLSQGASVGIAP